MLFNFSEEERARLEALDKEERDALAQLYDVHSRAAGTDVFTDAKGAFLSGQAQRNARFDKLVKQIESERFSRLHTPEEIFSDAITQAGDILPYAYTRIRPAIEEQNATNKKQTVFMLDLAGASFPISILQWDYDDLLRQQKDNPPGDDPAPGAAKARFFFVNNAAAVGFLEKNLSKHMEALKGTTAETELKKALRNIVSASPFVGSVRQAGGQELQDAVTITAYEQTPNVCFTFDKLARALFDGHTVQLYQEKQKRKRGDIPGQLSFFPVPVSYEKQGKEPITLLIQDMKFDKGTSARLGLSEVLDDEDFFYLTFLDNAFMNGNKYITPTKLYRDYMGAEPNDRQLREFMDKLERMATTTIRINDREIQEKMNPNGKGGTYREILQQVAPIAIGSERLIVNGKISDAAIKIYDRPAVLSIGQSIGQYTTIPKSLLIVRNEKGRIVRRTNRFYRILRYLVYRIARMKSGKEAKILYDTFYEDMGETTPKGKQLAKNTMYMILEHFRREDWISGYKEETTKSTGEIGVKILLDSKKALPAKTKKDPTGRGKKASKN